MRSPESAFQKLIGATAVGVGLYVVADSGANLIWDKPTSIAYPSIDGLISNYSGDLEADRRRVEVVLAEIGSELKLQGFSGEARRIARLREEVPSLVGSELGPGFIAGYTSGVLDGLGDVAAERDSTRRIFTQSKMGAGGLLIINGVFVLMQEMTEAEYSNKSPSRRRRKKEKWRGSETNVRHFPTGNPGRLRRGRS